MASWKKVLVSGSSIEVNQITASGVPTVNNETNLLALSADGGITQISQGDVAGTNPTFNIVAISGSTTTNTDFNTTDQLIFSHSLDHGFGFTITDSSTTSSIILQTPQDLRTTASPTFDDVNVSDSIFHDGDANTAIAFASDTITLHAGAAVTNPQLTVNSSGIILNSSGQDYDFTVKTGQTEPLFYIDAGTDQVFIGTSSHSTNDILIVSGNIHAAGITASALQANTTSTTAIVDGGSGVFEKRDIVPIIQSTAGDYTASFSSSITGTASEVKVTGTPGNVVVGLPSDVTIGNNLTVSNNLDLTGGNITVEGHISASGNITASNIRIDNDIALGGNIFSFSGFSFIEGISANLSGSTTFGSGSNPGANDTAGGGVAHQFTGSVGITGSALIITDGDLTLNAGSIAAENNTGSFGFITAAEISSSGQLFASLSNDNTNVADGVVVYDNSTGQFLTTASAAIGVNNYTDLANIPSAIVSSSTLTSDGQGSVKLTTNGVENDITSTIGLETTDLPSFAGLTITGNITASGDISSSGDLTVGGFISGSGQLFASLSLDSTTSYNTVMYNTTTGQFFYTGSYGSGGGVSNYTDLNSIPNNIISSSGVSSNGQGQITSSVNGVSSSFDVGLLPADTPTFAGLTITSNASIAGNATIAGDLIVEGNTTTISTSNLTIEDKFISLNSGSLTDASAGIVVERSAGVGTGLFWDNGTNMWSIDKATANANNNSATADLKVATIQHAGAIPTNPNYGVTTNTYAAAKGSLFIDTGDDFGVYIWV